MRATKRNVRAGRVKRALNARDMVTAICDAFDAQYPGLQLTAAVSSKGFRFTVHCGATHESFELGAASSGAEFAVTFSSGLKGAMQAVNAKAFAT